MKYCYWWIFHERGGSDGYHYGGSRGGQDWSCSKRLDCCLRGPIPWLMDWMEAMQPGHYMDTVVRELRFANNHQRLVYWQKGSNDKKLVLCTRGQMEEQWRWSEGAGGAQSLCIMFMSCEREFAAKKRSVWRKQTAQNKSKRTLYSEAKRWRKRPCVQATRSQNQCCKTG